MRKSLGRSEFDRQALEALTGPPARLDTRKTGLKAIAAMRRGDRTGAEIAISDFVASVPLDVLPAGADAELGLTTIALCDLALKLAEIAAEEGR